MRSKIIWIIITGLLVGGAVLCGLRWKAWFVTPPEPKWVGDTIDYRFSTFANEDVCARLQKDTLEFILFGDIHNSLNNSDMANIFAAHNDIDFYAQIGDWMDRPYFYHEQMMYQSLVGTGFDSLPIIACPGNHEYKKGLVKNLFERWQDIFPNPTNGPTRFVGRTYFVDFPHLRIVVIDTDGLQRFSDYTQLNFWVKNALYSVPNKMKIVMMHHPVFSTAKGRQNPVIWSAFYGAFREANVVFSGHDHNYVRRTVEYKERFWSEQQPTVFIATNASNKEYPVKENINSINCFSSEPVYQWIQSTPDRLYIRTYNVHSSALIDEVVVSKFLPNN